MSETPDHGRARQQILHDHHEIETLVGQVAPTSTREQTLAALTGLQPILQRHFAKEEEQIDGLHNEILHRTPRHANALAGLKDEHRELLASLQQLLDKANEKSVDDASLQTLGAEFRARLAEHEARETEIFVDSIWTDLGAGD